VEEGTTDSSVHYKTDLAGLNAQPKESPLEFVKGRARKKKQMKRKRSPGWQRGRTTFTGERIYEEGKKNFTRTIITNRRIGQEEGLLGKKGGGNKGLKKGEKMLGNVEKEFRLVSQSPAKGVRQTRSRKRKWNRIQGLVKRWPIWLGTEKNGSPEEGQARERVE